MKEYQSLDFEQQLNLFLERGMTTDNKSLHITKLKYINYYKLKELAYPFYKKDENGEYSYQNINFNGLLRRYYQDKRIRLAIMNCTEKIEIAFKTRFCHLLGSKYGSFGYLKFNNWCNKEKYCKHYIEEKQGDFKKRLNENEYLFRTKCIENYFREINRETKNIPVWMLVEVLTFGEILYLYNLMSVENQIKLAKDFNCKAEELHSWLKAMKFIRNQCAHNSNVIDLELRTKPKLREEWKTKLLINSSNESSGRLSDALIPMIYLTVVINNKHYFNELQASINKLVSDDLDKSQMLGFKNIKSAKNIVSFLGGNFRTDKDKYVKCKKR